MGFVIHKPTLTLLCVSLPDSGSLDSVVPSCSSSWPTGRSLFQKPSLVLLFLYFISCFKKKSQICCLSVFKIGDGRLGDCFCVVALVHSSYMLYLNFSDDFLVVVITRQSSLPNAVDRQSGERLASRLPV